MIADWKIWTCTNVAAISNVDSHIGCAQNSRAQRKKEIYLEVFEYCELSIYYSHLNVHDLDTNWRPLVNGMRFFTSA